MALPPGHMVAGTAVAVITGNVPVLMLRVDVEEQPAVRPVTVYTVAETGQALSEEATTDPGIKVKEPAPVAVMVAQLPGHTEGLVLLKTTVGSGTTVRLMVF